MKKTTQAVSKETRDEATQDKALVRALKLGLDVHYRQGTVAMQEDGGRIKAAGKMSHEAFLDWVRTKLEEGWRIDSCYEAGASGYWLHRELVELGVQHWFKVASGINGLLPVWQLQCSCQTGPFHLFRCSLEPMFLRAEKSN